jgi:hypothetical protein
MKYVIRYFDICAEGWYLAGSSINPLTFDSEEAALEFLNSPRQWPKEVDTRALLRAKRECAADVMPWEK